MSDVNVQQKTAQIQQKEQQATSSNQFEEFDMNEGHEQKDEKVAKGLFWRLRSHRHISRTLLDITLNNIVSENIYNIFLIVEGVILTYIPLIITYGNLSGKNLAQLYQIDTFLTQPSSELTLIINGAVFAIFLIFGMLLLKVFYDSDQDKSLHKLHHSKYASAVSLFYGLLSTIMYAPSLLLVLHTFILPIDKSTMTIVSMALATLNTILFLTFPVFINKLVIIRFENEYAPWSSISLKVQNLFDLQKSCLMVWHTCALVYYDVIADMYIYGSLLFVYSVCLGTLRIIDKPYQSKMEDKIKRAIDWLISAVLCGTFIRYTLVLADIKRENLFFVCILILILLFQLIQYTMGAFLKEKFFIKIISNTQKTEEHYATTFSVIQHYLSDLDGSEKQQESSIKKLFTILESHSYNCKQSECLCIHINSIIWVLKSQSYTSNQNSTLLRIDIDLLNRQKRFELFDLKPTFNSGFSSWVNQNNLIQQDQQQTQLSESVNINFQVFKQSFFAHFMNENFVKPMNKLQYNQCLMLNTANYSIRFLNNPYLCLNMLKDIDDQRMGWVNKINLNMNKLLIIHASQEAISTKDYIVSGFSMNKFGLVNTSKDKRQQNQMAEYIDVERFLSINKLLYKFNYQSKCLSYLIHGFWSRFLMETLNPELIFRIGDEISENIKCIYKYFHQIDEECKQKNYKIYQQFSLIQKLLLNDQHTYELYLGKMKGILMMQKINKNSYYNSQKFEFEIGIMQVQGKFSSFGRIMFVNHILVKVANYKSYSELKHRTIEIFLPTMVKQFHSRMVERFKQTGEENVFNRDTNRFLINKDGYLVPIELNIKYYYSSINNEHTYIAFVNTIKTFKLETNAVAAQNVRKILLFMFDNEDGRIFDMNLRSMKKLGITLDNLDEGPLRMDKNYICISDIFPDISMDQINMNDTSIITGQMQVNCDIMKNIYQLQSNTPSRMRQGQYQIFKESYAHNTCQANILALVLEKGQSQLVNGRNRQVDDSDYLQNKKINDSYLKQSDQANGDNTDDQQYSFQFDSSDNGSSQSSSTTRDAGETLKNKYTSMEINTPRSLQLVLQLTLLLFMASLIISSVIYFLSKNQQLLLQNKMIDVQASFDKVEANSKASIIIRSYLNIVNGFGGNSSSVLPNRQASYLAKLVHHAQEIAQFQSITDNAISDYSPTLLSFVQAKQIQLAYLNEYDTEYYQNQTMSFAVNDFSSKLALFTTLDTSLLHGNLDILTLTPNRSIYYQPNDTERLIYYLVNNGIDVLRVQMWRYADMYCNDTLKHVSDTQYQDQIMLLISLGTITIIGMILTPFAFKIMDRKYNALEVFTFVEKESIIQVIQQSKECMMSFSENSFKLSSKHDKRNKSTLNEEGHEDLKAQKKYGPQYKNSELQRSEYSAKIEDNFSFVDIGNEASGRLDISQSILKQSHNAYLESSHQSEDLDKTGAQPSKRPSQSKFPTTKSLRISKYLDDSIQNGANQMFSQSKDQEKEIDSKENQLIRAENKVIVIKKLKRTSRILTTFFVITIIAVLCVYFLTSYMMATTTYNQVGSVLDVISLLYEKDSCIDQMIAYFRECQIRNESMLLFEDPTQVATAYFINKCMGVERDYLAMRINIPTALKNMQTYMDKVESNQLCPTVFSDDPDSERICANAYYGILNKGLSNTIAYMIQHFSEADLEFTTIQNRSIQQLEGFINDNETLELIDIKDYLMDSLFDEFKAQVTFDYFITMLAQFKIVFKIYVVAIIIFIFIFVFVVFSRIRVRLWKLSIMMKILPITMMPPDKMKQVKNFFNSQ